MLKKFENLPLRDGVGIIVINNDNKIFVAKRIDSFVSLKPLTHIMAAIFSFSCTSKILEIERPLAVRDPSGN